MPLFLSQAHTTPIQMTFLRRMRLSIVRILSFVARQTMTETLVGARVPQMAIQGVMVMNLDVIYGCIFSLHISIFP